jgi:hypothetical protein
MSKKFSAAALIAITAFAGSGHRIRHIRQHQIVGLAVLRAEDGFHGRT